MATAAENEGIIRRLNEEVFSEWSFNLIDELVFVEPTTEAESKNGGAVA